MKTPIAVDFEDVPGAMVPEVDKNVFKSIVHDEHVILVRGKYNDEWRTFVALLFDAETGRAINVEKAQKNMDGFKLIIKPIGMLFDSEGVDLGRCKSADGTPILFDEVELNQKPS